MKRVPPEEIVRERLLLFKPEGGLAARTSKEGGLGVCVLSYRGTTNSEGAFSIDVAADGEVHLVAFPREHGPAYESLASVRGERTSVRLHSRRATEQARLRFTLGGEVLTGCFVILADHSFADGLVQPAVTLEMDADGGVPVDWLLAGCSYGLAIEGGGIPGGRASGTFVWSGQQTLDLLRDIEKMR
ncbi:MAG: hypothetical protein ACT4PV_00945 [Planctomycetaceae bacterium]